MRPLAALAALLVAGCASTIPPAPGLVRPEFDAGSFAPTPVAAAAPVPDDWWRLFDDPALDELVQASLAANLDLAVAYANLDGARAALRLAQAVRLPRTSVESNLGLIDQAKQPGGSPNLPATEFELAATASWDADLFGRLRSAAFAARADAEAQAAALDGVRVAVVADTVLAYVDLCGATGNLAVAREQVAVQERALRIVTAQFAAGEVSPLEVAQVEALVAASRAVIAPLEAAQANARFRLATLAGRKPADPLPASVTCTVPPKLVQAAPVGDGTALLLRRPDIREADRRLAATTARIGIARADLYPRLNLGGAIGLLSGGLVAIGAPLVTWTFPEQSPVRARIAQAEAAERAALATWDGTVLRALRDVETALAAYAAEARRNTALIAARGEAQLLARRAEARVRLGEAEPLVRVDALRTLAQAELALAQSDLAVAQAQVGLFRALGGGWRDAAQPLD